MLLVGSPRGSSSTSRSLGRYLLDRMADRGWEAEEVHVQRAVRSPEGTAAMVASASSADLVVLSLPTYVDSTPAAVIRAMEALAHRRAGSGKKTGLVAIANCGFLEAGQNRTTIEICRLFARDAGFEWRGGLALGGGGAVNGRPLAEAGGVARNARKALDRAAEALAQGKEVPEEAARLMARPIIPRFLYTLAGNSMWRKMAKANGALERIEDRPYLEEGR